MRFESKDLMISLVPANAVDGGSGGVAIATAPQAQCGNCTGCSACTDCSNCTACSNCTCTVCSGAGCKSHCLTNPSAEGSLDIDAGMLRPEHLDLLRAQLRAG